jgi:hypothetical protein
MGAEFIGERDPSLRSNVLPDSDSLFLNELRRQTNFRIVKRLTKISLASTADKLENSEASKLSFLPSCTTTFTTM